jgi:predicted Zn-dependent protease
MKNILRRFPLLVALGALLVYALTLSRGVTVNSLSLTAKIAGWNWQPMVGEPLLWLLTLPLRLLPAGWVPPALNLFSAACAAATLGILARSLELMPWLRPLESLGRWRQRLPVWLAVAVCGLEFHFWQEAAGATGEMLDVLLLAAALWCLLEFRADGDRRWLRAAVFVWGVGMAQNWMMVLTLPLFVAGLVWLRPLNFLRWRFVLTLAGWGLAGFSVYALLPLVNGLLPGSPWGMGEAWLYSLKQTKQLLAGVYFQFWRAHRLMGMVMVIFYLLPLLACLVRLGDEDTANKSPLDRFQIWLFRALRAMLLLACVWLAFDPVNGPHGIVRHKLNLGLSLLSFDYLNGLGAGFLAGNLLLMRRKSYARHDQFRHGPLALVWLERAALPALLALALVATAGLAARNAAAVTFVNRHSLSQFGEQALDNLPPGGGVVLADFPERLAVFQAAGSRRGGSSGWMTVDTRSLPEPDYRERLERLRPGAWLPDTNRHVLAPAEMVQLLAGLARTNRVFYLHPSFGHFFEVFYQEPCGPVSELKFFPTNAINPPALTPEIIARNERFWDGLTPQLDSLQRAGAATKNRALGGLEKKLHLEPVVQGQALLLQEWYAAALDGWGVELQRAGRLPEAERRFTQSLALNPNNWIVRANLFCNTNLQAGNRLGMTDVGNLASQIRSPQNFTQFLGQFGPVDEPSLCQLLGNACASAGLMRQALIHFERAAALAPTVPAPQLALASLYARCGLGGKSLEVIERLRALMKNSPDYPVIDLELALIEAGVNFNLSRTNLAGSRQVLQSLLDRYPENARVENRVLQAYVAFGDLTNAESLASSLLSQQPEDFAVQLTKTGILIRTGRPAEAIPILNQILSVTNFQPARINRAIAYLLTTNNAAAKADYLELQAAGANPFFVNVGLAELAFRERDTNQAVRHFSAALTNAQPGSVQWRAARARLDALSPSAGASTAEAASK